MASEIRKSIQKAIAETNKQSNLITAVLAVSLFVSPQFSFAETVKKSTEPAKPEITVTSGEGLAATATCVRRGLFEPSELKRGNFPDELKTTKALYEMIDKFETAFQKKDAALFRSLVHPAIHKSAKEVSQIFENTFVEFNLGDAKLARARVYEFYPKSNEDPTALCPDGTVRGVAGPKRQFAVMFTHAMQNSQIRIFALFAPILKEQQKPRSKGHILGLVMLHTQVWSHGGKSAEVLLKEAEAMRPSNPKAAYFIAQASERMLSANPYFAPDSLNQAKALTESLSEHLLAIKQADGIVKSVDPKWSFIGFTSVFQKEGIEPGIKLQYEGEEIPIDMQLGKCRQMIGKVMSELPSLRDVFKGVECLSYRKGEDYMATAPANGSQFFPWSTLNEPASTGK